MNMVNDMTRRRRRNKIKAKVFSYPIEINGLLFVLVSILGIGGSSFGIVGKITRNFAMFVMGDYAIIFLASLLFLGIYMVIKGDTPEFFSSRKIGYYILVIVILVFAHTNFIQSNDLSIDIMFKETYENLMKVFDQNNVITTVGGGFLGAVLSWVFISLFAASGTKIVLVILIIFGIVMLFDISIGDVIKKISEIFTKIKNRPKKAKADITFKPDEDTRVLMEYDRKPVYEENKHEEQLSLAKVIENGEYVLPPIDIFDNPAKKPKSNSTEFLKNNKIIIERVLNDFQLYGRVVNIHEGPAVTQYEVEIKSGTKLSRIVSINRELALALAAKDVRIMAPIPGKSTVGIEIPNRVITPVPIREVLENIPRQMENSNILLALGKDLMGNVMTADLTNMPHLLVAGSTGSGKSVCINSFIASILMRYTPKEVKLVLVDPKKVELSNYKNIPHLLYPVVTDPRKANIILKKIVEEMENRYTLFNDHECKSISTYNEYLEKEQRKHPTDNIQILPYIVMIIDELADLMLVSAREVEDSIMRITQMARAAGIHLIVATQRPSTDVVTGIVKANIPSRLSFSVSSGIDSRTILDMQGAEKLLGKGDMLYLPMGENSPVRIQGTFISDDEIKRLVDFVTSNGEAKFDEETLNNMVKLNPNSEENYEDPIYDEVVEYAILSGEISASKLQRKYRIGFNRAARIIDLLESRQIVGPQKGSKPREVLVKFKDEE